MRIKTRYYHVWDAFKKKPKPKDIIKNEREVNATTNKDVQKKSKR